MAVRGRRATHRLVVDALAVGIATFGFLVAPQLADPALACDPHTGAGCDMGPPPTHPPATQPPATQPPATDPPETQPFVPSQPDPEPPAEDFTPSGPVTFRPSIPAAPAGPFVPADADADTAAGSDVQLVDVAPDDPQPQAAPPPPPPPEPTSNAASPLALSLAGAGGMLAGDTLRRSRDQDAQDQFIDATKVAGAQYIGGMVIFGATGAGINAGVLAIGTTAVIAPLGIAVGLGLVMMGAIGFMTLPKAQSNIHQGSVRG